MQQLDRRNTYTPPSTAPAPGHCDSALKVPRGKDGVSSLKTRSNNSEEHLLSGKRGQGLRVPVINMPSIPPLSKQYFVKLSQHLLERLVSAPNSSSLSTNQLITRILRRQIPTRERGPLDGSGLCIKKVRHRFHNIQAIPKSTHRTAMCLDVVRACRRCLSR